MTCARSANLGGLTALIADGADVNARETSRGQTALMWAVAHRQSEIVAALLEAGANVHATTASEPRRSFVGNRMIVFDMPEHPGIQTIPYGGFTPLLFAAQQDDLESARLLLEAGADVNDTSAAGVSALTMAAHSGHGSLGSFLLAHGADPNAAGAGYTALHAAVLAGDLGLVEALLAHNADPNAVLTNGTPVRKHSQDLAFNIDWRGATPFWLAAQFAELDMMRALATAGADPRATAMGDQATTVMAAMRIGTGNRLSLSRRGLNLTNWEAELVDETAETARSVDAVERVLDLGADVDQPNARGETPLHVAVTQESLPLIRLLVDRGANINARNNEGKTPLGVTLARAAAAAEARPNVLRLTEAKDPNVNPVADLLRSLGATE